MDTSLPFRVCTVLAALLLAVIIVASPHPPEANAQATLPSGFHEKVVLGGPSEPSNVEFSKDGRVFVAEKSGLIKVFDGLNDKTPTTFADLRTKVHNFWDRGCSVSRSTQVSLPNPTSTLSTPTPPRETTRWD